MSGKKGSMPHRGISSGMEGAHKGDHSMADIAKGYKKEGTPAEEMTESPAFEKKEDASQC